MAEGSVVVMSGCHLLEEMQSTGLVAEGCCRRGSGLAAVEGSGCHQSRTGEEAEEAAVAADQEE